MDASRRMSGRGCAVATGEAAAMKQRCGLGRAAPWFAVAFTALVVGCGQPAPPVPASPSPPSATSSIAGCIEQPAWERHEGTPTGHWEAAKAAAASEEATKGDAEALLAASEAASMAAEARSVNPAVARELQRAADNLVLAAAAFRVGDFTAAASRIAAADDAHQLALGSTTAQDWCQAGDLAPVARA